MKIIPLKFSEKNPRTETLLSMGIWHFMGKFGEILSYCWIQVVAEIEPLEAFKVKRLFLVFHSFFDAFLINVVENGGGPGGGERFEQPERHKGWTIWKVMEGGGEQSTEKIIHGEIAGK